MINNPDTQPKHVEQGLAAEVTPSVLHSGAVVEFQKLYDALLAQVRMHERRGLAVPAVISMLLLTLALTLSPGTAETTYAKTGDQDKTEQTTPPETETEVFHCGPPLQEFQNRIGWEWLARLSSDYANSFFCNEVKVFWSREKVNADDGYFNPIVFSENLGKTFWFPPTPYTPEMEVPVPNFERNAETYLTITNDQLVDWVLQAPGFPEFLERIKAKAVAYNEAYADRLPQMSVRDARLLGVDEKISATGELEMAGGQIEIALDYYPRDPQVHEVVFIRIEFAALPDDDGTFTVDETQTTVTALYIDVAEKSVINADGTPLDNAEAEKPIATPTPTGTPIAESPVQNSGKPKFGDLDLRPTDQPGKPTVEPTATALGTPVMTSEDSDEQDPEAAVTATSTATLTSVGTPTAEGTPTVEVAPNATAELAPPERSAVTAEDLVPFGESVVRNVGEYIERKVFVSVGEKDTTYPRYSFLNYQNEHPSLSDNYRTRITQSQLELGPRDIRFGEVSISEDGTQLWVADALAEEGQEPTLLTVQLPEGHRFVVQGEPQVRSNASGSLTVIEGVAMQQGNDPVDADNPALILKWITLPGATKLAEKLDISVDTELVTALRGPSLEQIEMLPGERLAAYDNVVYGVTVNTEGIHLRQLDSTKGLEVFRVLDSEGTLQSDGRYPAVPYTQTITWDAFSARGFDPSNIASVEATTVLLRGPLQREPYMAPEDDVLTIELKGKQNPPGEDFEGYLIFQASLTSMYGDYSQSGSTQDYTGLEFKFVEGRSYIYVDLPKPTPTPTESPRAAETMTIQDKMNFFAEEVAAGRVSVAEQARWQLFVALWQTDQLIEPQVANVKVLGEPEHDNLFINEVLDTQQFPDIFSDQRAGSPIYIMQAEYRGVYFRFIQPEWIDGKLQVVILDGITGKVLKNDQKDIVAEYLNNLNLPYELVAGNYVYSVFSGVDTFRPFYPSN